MALAICGVTGVPLRARVVRKMWHSHIPLSRRGSGRHNLLSFFRSDFCSSQFSDGSVEQIDDNDAGLNNNPTYQFLKETQEDQEKNCEDGTVDRPLRIAPESTQKIFSQSSDDMCKEHGIPTGKERIEMLAKQGSELKRYSREPLPFPHPDDDFYDTASPQGTRDVLKRKKMFVEQKRREVLAARPPTYSSQCERLRDKYRTLMRRIRGKRK
eukprot:242178_1